MADPQPRVLVVDDDPGVLQSLELLLSDDCEVTVCDSPTYALEVAAATPFDVIITDYRMPHMNGAEFAAAIEAFTQILKQCREGRVLRGFLQTGQGAHDRNTGFKQGVHLTAEQHQIKWLYFLFAQQISQPATLAQRCAQLSGQLDLGRGNSNVEQLIGNGTAISTI